MAGTVATFRIPAQISYGCGAVLLAVLLARAVLGPRPAWFAVRAVIVLLMLGATLYSGLVVSGRVEAARAAIGTSPSSLPDGDPRRAEFGRLHATSTGLQLIPLVGGLALLFLELKDS